MKVIRKVYHFLGSVYFALFLIASVALFVIVGTFIESTTESHQHAAYFTYQNPLFIALLYGFFINILLSALRRWPFRWKHAPFLITHFGLLMILTGTIAKSYFGIQGSLFVLEGAGQDELTLPNTYAVQITQKDLDNPHQLVSTSFPLAPQITHPDFTMELIAWHPHCNERWDAWIKKDYAVILGLPPIPLRNDFTPSIVAPLAEGKDPWTIYAARNVEPEKYAEKIYLQNPKQKPSLLLIEDGNKDIHFFAFDSFGGISSSIFQREKPFTVIAYDQGFKGYTAQVEIPISLPEPLKGLHEDKIVRFFKFWHESGHWILPEGILLPEELVSDMENLDWKNTPHNILSACAYSCVLIQQALSLLHEGTNVYEALQKIGWPLLHKLPPSTDTSESLSFLLQQIFSLSEHLPPISQKAETLTPQQKAAYLSAFLRAYHQNENSIVLETPLSRVYEQSPPQKKWEDNQPKAIFKIKKGQQTEFVSTAYNRNEVALKMPILKGQYLLSLEPQQIKIPYRIRLKQARTIFYPNSNQPYSYESDLLITDLLQNKGQEKTLSMNNVHETWDGYRFYLANVGTTASGIKKIHVVVNYDPAKYFLTYPGAFILSLGIVLLFLFTTKQN